MARTPLTKILNGTDQVVMAPKTQGNRQSSQIEINLLRFRRLKKLTRVLQI